MDRHMRDSLDHWLTTPPSEHEPDPDDPDYSDPEDDDDFTVTLTFVTPKGTSYAFDFNAQKLTIIEPDEDNDEHDS